MRVFIHLENVGRSSNVILLLGGLNGGDHHQALLRLSPKRTCNTANKFSCMAALLLAWAEPAPTKIVAPSNINILCKVVEILRY